LWVDGPKKGIRRNIMAFRFVSPIREFAAVQWAVLYIIEFVGL
jgi:hypothetical protein